MELVFSVENPKVLDAIRQLGIETEDETVILSRKITSGRAIARINGEAVSASRLKEVASLLIDIHGQHEHQSLLSKKKHLEILDAYAKDALGEKKERLAACYQEYRKAVPLRFPLLHTQETTTLWRAPRYPKTRTPTLFG